MIVIPKKAKSKNKHKSVQTWKMYEVKGNELVRKNRQCPKCKKFLANMKDRVYCGGCGYTEISRK